MGKSGFILYIYHQFYKMLHVVGTYECKADIKGRVMLPNALKKQLSAVLNDGFIIKRSVFNKCLELHPFSEWKHVMNQVNKLNRFLKKNNDFIRSYMSGLKQISIDRSSRFLVPKDLSDFASIRKEIVLSSCVNMIEIWDKKEYEKSLKDTLKDFGNLVEDVMGKNHLEN